MRRPPSRERSASLLVRAAQAVFVVGALVGCDDSTLTDGSSSGGTNTSGTGGNGGARSCVERTVPGATTERGLVTHGESVFFVRPASNENPIDAIVRADLDTEAVPIIFQENTIGPFVADGDDLVVAVDEEILRVPMDGGPSTLLVATVPGAKIIDLAIEPSAITWIESPGELRRFENGVTTTFPGSYGALLQSGPDLVAHTHNGYLDRVESSGITPIQGFTGHPFLVYGGAVFTVSTELSPPRSFTRLDLATSQVTPLFESPDFGASHESDGLGIGDRVYVVTRGHDSSSLGSALIAIPVMGGEPTVIVETPAKQYLVTVARTDTRLVYSTEGIIRTLCLDSLPP